ncbi:hypothetical protein CWATWH0402_3091 [Crocosphaera watsonii WH 0402]|uniref:Uncharacterized protein n=1 Tax=Crocosphaera watsonii WH 0402 TaxID=1284629 RepID=T2JRT7_CROWT|nr:hypothetical protein CWATWH0402_3091 [Crocosphaera watsonii WH 0402]
MLLTRGSAIREHPNVVFLSFLDNSLSDEFTPPSPPSPPLRCPPVKLQG